MIDNFHVKKHLLKSIKIFPFNSFLFFFLSEWCLLDSNSYNGMRFFFYCWPSISSQKMEEANIKAWGDMFQKYIEYDFENDIRAILTRWPQGRWIATTQYNTIVWASPIHIWTLCNNVIFNVMSNSCSLVPRIFYILNLILHYVLSWVVLDGYITIFYVNHF